MAKKSEMRVDIEKLKRLAESLKVKPHVDVGVFASKAARRETDTNAYLAMVHEFGSPKHGLPPRSMLRVPIAEHAQQIMASVKGQAEQLVKEKGAKSLWDRVGKAAEKVVIGAFDTGGYGKWAPTKVKTTFGKLKGSMKRRLRTFYDVMHGKTGMGILVDTAQLKRSFSSRVRMAFR